MEELEILKSKLSIPSNWVLEHNCENENLKNELEDIVMKFENLGRELSFFEVLDLIEYLEKKEDLEYK